MHKVNHAPFNALHTAAFNYMVEVKGIWNFIVSFKFRILLVLSEASSLKRVIYSKLTNSINIDRSVIKRSKKSQQSARFLHQTGRIGSAIQDFMA